MDIGIYALQAARYLSGEEPVEVEALMHSTPGDPRFTEVEENVTFQLRFPGGILASCSSSYGVGLNRYRVFKPAGSVGAAARAQLHRPPHARLSGTARSRRDRSRWSTTSRRRWTTSRAS